MSQQLDVPLLSVEYQGLWHDAAIPDINLVDRRLNIRVWKQLRQPSGSKLRQSDLRYLLCGMQTLKSTVCADPFVDIFLRGYVFVFSVEGDVGEGDNQEVDGGYPELLAH